MLLPSHFCPPFTQGGLGEAGATEGGGCRWRGIAGGTSRAPSPTLHMGGGCHRGRMGTGLFTSSVTLSVSRIPCGDLRSTALPEGEPRERVPQRGVGADCSPQSIKNMRRFRAHTNIVHCQLSTVHFPLSTFNLPGCASPFSSIYKESSLARGRRMWYNVDMREANTIIGKRVYI